MPAGRQTGSKPRPPAEGQAQDTTMTASTAILITVKHVLDQLAFAHAQPVDPRQDQDGRHGHQLAGR